MQAHKFVGSSDPNARSYFEEIFLAKSPEEAARMGRKMQREHPHMVCYVFHTLVDATQFSSSIF